MIWVLTLLVIRADDFSELDVLQVFVFEHIETCLGYDQRIRLLAGLDPSTIYFEGGDTTTRLDPSDALLVDVIHTDASYSQPLRDHLGLGFQSALGVFLFVKVKY